VLAADRPSVADVYKEGRLAATLTRETDGVRFAYLPDYLDAAPRPVATTLPLTEEPVLSPPGAVPPYFAGLLPEGRRLTGLRRALKASADDELTLLLAVGMDPVGDVQVVPHGEEPKPPEPLIRVARSFDEIVFSDVLEQAGVIDPVALAGVQDKASARMISVPVSREGERYILKVDPPEFPRVVVNEAFFLRVARAARFPVVDAQVVHDSTGRPGLLVRRFDRVIVDGKARALAVEDAAQALNLYPADKYSVEAEAAVEALSGLCAARPVAVRDLFRQLVFAWLTGNGDVHAKNLSVLATPAGEWRVAPAYDLPSTLPYRDHTMALPMRGRREGLSRRSLLELGDRIGLPRAAAERAIDEVLVATAEVVPWLTADPLGFPPQQLRSWVRALRNRRESAMPA
jgi:serine/threonine-protein kinase HipA